MHLISLVAVILAGCISTSEAGETCDWTRYPGKRIPGGEYIDVRDLEDCKLNCLYTSGCVSFDYQLSHNCWLQTTKEGMIDYEGIDHYSYDCNDPCSSSPCENGGTCSVSGDSYQCSCPSGYIGNNCEEFEVVGTDVNCIETNYPGPKTDLISSPNGVTWNFQLATVGFEFHKNDILTNPLRSIIKIDRITFVESENLNYFRVVFTKNDGQVIMTAPIGPNDKDTVLNDVTDVKRVDFYLAPVDFRFNVSIYNIKLKYCVKDILDGVPNSCKFLEFANDAVVSLGKVDIGDSQKSFSVSVALVSPFIEVNLTCNGHGTVTFSEIDFGQVSGFGIVQIDVWNGKESVFSRSFNYSQGIGFEAGVVGNRIRANIFPDPIPNQGISRAFGFSHYSVYASH